ncbi:hypothetical protein GCM10011360_23110 [Primorskyibacter flagellatus]|uniref:DUF4760 domain-containing protein n=1 Tax=Primorskyibacter flagellatus TaxID=1387277 RepID=A0A917A820_9RHOB|nr:hypothetical protein [Primorskyibacter flagellatus]GGE34614.1 hypothetical protein GCM10011360_23110 [Primorskyibacter flagellatus]
MEAPAPISWLSALDARIWQAVIAGAFVALGWMVNGWQNRRRDATLRAERLRDMHRALFAEIGAHLATLDTADELDRYGSEMAARIESEADFVPFIPVEHNDRVFEAAIDQIHILPRSSIDPVVAYYSQIRAIATLVGDMRGPGFAALSPQRRAAIYRDYIAMKKQASAFGHHALRIIDAYSKGGKPAAKAVEEERHRETVQRQKALSTPASGPSGPSRGSE